jgi:hypothetical protein
MIFISFIIPESEVWLRKKKGGKKSSLTRVVAFEDSGNLKVGDEEKLLGEGEFEDDENHENEGGVQVPNLPNVKQEASALWATIKSHKMDFLTSCILASMTQLTGINAILSYFPTIVKNMGVTSTGGQLGATVALGMWNMVTTIISIFLVLI